MLDLTHAPFYEIELHYADADHESFGFTIDTGDDYADVNEKLALSMGRQEKLPEWVIDGTIIGVQGGTEMVDQYIANASQYDIPVRGVWIQDWAGQIFTDFGDRVFWNWEWNETQYPALDQKIVEYAEQGIYFLNYLNPHLLNTETSQEHKVSNFIWKYSDFHSTVVLTVERNLNICFETKINRKMIIMSHN